MIQPLNEDVPGRFMFNVQRLQLPGRPAEFYFQVMVEMTDGPIGIRKGNSLELVIDGRKSVYRNKDIKKLPPLARPDWTSEQAAFKASRRAVMAIARAKKVIVNVDGEHGFKQGKFLPRNFKLFRKFVGEWVKK